MKRFIADGDWKILWGICSIVPFGIAFFLNWIFGSSGGWEALAFIIYTNRVYYCIFFKTKIKSSGNKSVGNRILSLGIIDDCPCIGNLYYRYP